MFDKQNMKNFEPTNKLNDDYEKEAKNHDYLN